MCDAQKEAERVVGDESEFSTGVAGRVGGEREGLSINRRSKLGQPIIGPGGNTLVQFALSRRVIAQMSLLWMSSYAGVGVVRVARCGPLSTIIGGQVTIGACTAQSQLRRQDEF